MVALLEREASSQKASGQEQPVIKKATASPQDVPHDITLFLHRYQSCVLTRAATKLLHGRLSKQTPTENRGYNWHLKLPDFDEDLDMNDAKSVILTIEGVEDDRRRNLEYLRQLQEACTPSNAMGYILERYTRLVVMNEVEGGSVVTRVPSSEKGYDANDDTYS